MGTAEEILEYELIDISFEHDYELTGDTGGFVHEDDPPDKEETQIT